MKVPLSWLKDFIKVSISADELSSLLTMCGLEVEELREDGGDHILSLNITPNRSDCLSILGIAREVSALTEESLSVSKIKKISGKFKMRDCIQVAIDDLDACPRYMARVIKGLKISDSPAWLTRRLELAGIRSINNVVDITNYVMLELGQPLHAFDLRSINGGRVKIRKAKVGEKLTALDENEYLLDVDDLLIADSNDGVALAGVMGGKNSEVRGDTKDVLLESAYFNPRQISRTSKRHGISTESSSRFERGVDPNGVELGLHRLTELILEIAGGFASSDFIDIYPSSVKPRVVSLRTDRANSHLGIKLSKEEVISLLRRLQIKFIGGGKDSLKFDVPTFRGDITREADLIEEIARIYGYHNIPERMPQIQIGLPSLPHHFALMSKVRTVLQSQGLSEARLLSFTSSKKLEQLGRLNETVVLKNPFSDEDAVLATTLIAGLLDVLCLNISHQKRDVQIFALQNIFKGREEILTLSGVLSGKRHPLDWENAGGIDFYDLKRVVESVLRGLGLKNKIFYHSNSPSSILHPGESARISVEGVEVGIAGKLHPKVSELWGLKSDVFLFELDFERVASICEKVKISFSEISKFPFIERDLALLVKDELTVCQIEQEIKKVGVSILNGLQLFDFYRGNGIPEGMKSLAFRLKFESKDKTLTDKEVDEALNKILNNLKESLGVSLRS